MMRAMDEKQWRLIDPVSVTAKQWWLGMGRVGGMCWGSW